MASRGGGLLGGIIGGIIGFVVGGPAGAFKGFMYGSTVGGLLAPPTGPDQVGPRLDDLTVTTSSNAAMLPRSYGRVGHKCNLIWVKGNKLIEVPTTKKVKSGFFSSTKVTTYAYYVTCAYSVAKGPIAAYLKVWLAGGRDLIYSATSDDLDTQLASGDGLAKYIRFYLGTDDQMPDPAIAEDVGAANCSAYRYVAYMVFDRMPLVDYQNSLGALDPKVEYTTVGSDASDADFICNVPAEDLPDDIDPYFQSTFPDLHNLTCLDANGANLWRFSSRTASGLIDNFDRWHYIALPDGSLTMVKQYEGNGAGTFHYQLSQVVGGSGCAAHGKSDRNVFVSAVIGATGGGGGPGDFPADPSLFYPGHWTYRNLNPLPGPPSEFDSFYAAFAYAATDAEWGTYPEILYEPDQQTIITDGGVPIGVLWSVSMLANAFEIFWSDGTIEYPPYVPFPITIGMFTGGMVAAISINVVDVANDTDTKYRIGVSSVDGLPKPEMHYTFYQDELFFGYSGSTSITLSKFSGGLRTGFASVSSVNFVKMGVLNDLLYVVSLNVSDLTEIYILDLNLEYVDSLDASEVNTEFGENDADFGYSLSFDFDKLFYMLAGNLKRRQTFTGTEIDLGDVPDLIPPTEDTAGLFNIHGKGSLLAVSTYGEPMPNTGVQFFSVGLLANPDKVLLADIITAESALVGLSSSNIDVSLITDEVTGFTIAQRGSVRNGLEQLRAAWPFDIVPSGYKTKFVPRGGSSVMTIPWEDLGKDVQLSQEREMEQQLPWKLILEYMDASLGYEINKQFSERPTNSDNEITLSLSIVFTKDEAAQKVDVLHSVYSTERIPKTFTLPPPYRGLEGADIVVLQMKNVLHTVRLESVHYTDKGSLQCTSRPHAPSDYTSVAVGSAPPPVPDTIPSMGISIGMVLDIPAISSVAVTGPSYVAVMSGITESWPGGTLYKLEGSEWVDVQGFVLPSNAGRCMTALAAHGCHLIDRGSSILMKPYIWDVVSVTELELLNETNLAAYGKHGRWEILSFQNVTDNMDGTYTLETFIRGLRGTEWTTGLHQSDDLIIMINEEAYIVGADVSDIDTTLTHRPVTNGRDITSASSIVINYVAENLVPHSPASARADATDNDDEMLISWNRRDRDDSGWYSYDDIPMSEETEQYQLKIYEDGSYATVLRTVETTAPAFLYTPAMMTEDFGDVVTGVYIEVRQISALVGLGHELRMWVEMQVAPAPILALYWGLEIGQAVSSSDVGISELYFYDADGNPIPTTGGTAHASSEFSGTYAKEKAFDGNTSNSWNSASSSFPARIYYQFAVPVAVASYKIRAIGTGDAPEDFKPIYSDDNVTFEFGVQRTGEVGWSAGTERTFSVF